MDARPLTLLATLPLGGYLLFHAWEQLAALGGREAWLERMRGTSLGPLALLGELALLLALAAWGALTLRSLARRETLPWAARSDDPLALRVITSVAPYMSVITLAFIGLHVVELWAPRVGGAGLAWSYATLHRDAGTPLRLAIYAAGMVATCWHLAAAIPSALEAQGWVRGAAARAQVHAASAVFALGLLVVLAQLYGWHATGAGTFWEIEVIEAEMEEPPLASDGVSQ